MAYASVGEVKRYLGIPAATTDDDVLLAEIIASAQAYIDSQTGRTFEATADSTRYFDAVRDVDGALLTFDNAFVASITSVTNGDGTTVTSGQYVTEPRRTGPYYGIRLKSSSGVAWTYTTDPENAIKIIGRWAYTTTPNYECQMACTTLAAMMYRQKDNIGDVTRPLLTGDGNVIMPTSIPKQTADFIATYRRRA